MLEKPDSKAERRKKKAARDTERKSARDEVVIMDNMTCRDCGQHNALSVHHIIKRRHGYDTPWNLITLCQFKLNGVQSCHDRAENGYGENGTRITAREYMIALLDRLGGRWGRAKKLLEAKL